MKKIILLAVLLIGTSLFISAQTKKVLLLGTFHFNNPGLDVAKTRSFDILDPAAQAELETISEKIKAFNPDKIFVEWDHTEQARLDSLYAEYLDGTWLQWTKTGRKKNEIFQLAGRTGKKLHHKKLFAFDYGNTEFPYDSLQTVLAASKQDHLTRDIEASVKAYTRTFDSLIATNISLTGLLLFHNTAAERKDNIGWYTRSVIQAGDTNNFIGAYLASEWYRRNIYMWSLIQKMTSNSDKRIMVLVGAGHAAVLQSFIDLDPSLERVELKEVLEQK